MVTSTVKLKDKLHAKEIVVAPGVYDALGASLAQSAGFDTVYLSGASLAYTKLGQPDIGLLSFTEIADSLWRIRDRTDLSIVADCDTGFGNALNAMRCVKMLERAGANAIQLEDQTYPKRCGHLAGKNLIPLNEMVGKLKAALDARQSEDTLIVARTDALGVIGTDEAIERALAFKECGADMVFVEGIRSDDDIQKIMTALNGEIPIMANMVEGGDTPLKNAEILQELGFSLVIFPGALVRAVTAMASEFFATLKKDGTTDNFRDRMLNFTQLNEFLGTAEMLAMGQKYEGDK
ncbi:isocitrate lyase/PEP mutase family protein [Terasakiella pusilla]|jgi:2-methylisocitrate lyase-like PEP mutase family enzyme|uniref:isocitrate lyase/PEP mutase family protein n=1 Tax=Terasakiella pusilla TaxID=64973 RepID=UPI00056DA171|nr:oxaloacetate decarboxylase [Terasakiella pusilla]